MQEDAEEICRTEFKSTARGAGYLGEGVYFFDNQPGHARDWARNQCAQRARGARVAVIESEIRFGKLLNLTDHEHFQAVKWFKSEFEEKARAKASLATIIDIVADKTGADVVKGCRIPYKPVVMDLAFSADVEIILAVRAIGNILSKKVVLSEMIL